MKQLIAIIILNILVNVLCIWDFTYTNKTFDHMREESSEIYQALLATDVDNEEVANKILNLKRYWTKKMDILAISISRKDLQPVSDHLQFLDSAITNKDQETAVTYSLLLKYNIEGLEEITDFHFLNIL